MYCLKNNSGFDTKEQSFSVLQGGRGEEKSMLILYLKK